MTLLQNYSEADITAILNFHNTHCKVGTTRRRKNLFVRTLLAGLNHENVIQELRSQEVIDDLICVYDLLCAVEEEEIRQFGTSE